MFDWIKRAVDAVRRKPEEPPEPVDLRPMPPLQRDLLTLPLPAIVKQLLRKSAFTKRGPGVLANLRNDLARLTPAQRIVARRMGWDRGMVGPQGQMR